MAYRIKSRLADLSKTQVDLIRELKKKNIEMVPSLLSNYITEVRSSKQGDMVLSVCDGIITKWESEVKQNAKTNCNT